MMKTLLVTIAMALLGLSACAPRSATPPGDIPAPSSKKGYVGLSKQEAIARAWSEGRRFRVVEEDGDRRPVTKDKRPNRLNFTVQRGIVTRVTLG